MRKGSRPEAMLAVAFIVVGHTALFGFIGLAIYLLVGGQA